ncbi:hypothetical protein D3C84_822380 [compost metagenome]
MAGACRVGQLGVFRHFRQPFVCLWFAQQVGAAPLRAGTLQFDTLHQALAFIPGREHLRAFEGRPLNFAVAGIQGVITLEHQVWFADSTGACVTGNLLTVPEQLADLAFFNAVLMQITAGVVDDVQIPITQQADAQRLAL